MENHNIPALYEWAGGLETIKTLITRFYYKVVEDDILKGLDLTAHEAYNDTMQKVMSVFGDPERQKNYSTPEQIAEVYEAATDGKHKLRYLAGEDAKAMYEQRKQAGDEQFREGVKARFLGQ